MADQAVLEVQNWLNATYGNVSGFEKVNPDGHTGWPTIYALREALQHELGITDIGEGFGPATRSALASVVGNLKPGYTGNIAQLIQGAFWCKGIDPGSNLNQEFSTATQQAFKTLQTDAGLNADGIVTVNLMAALFDMSAFVLVAGGDKNVRQLQQWLNADYSQYIGIMPCDGIYQRDTNVGLIYALQRALGISADVANGNFGDATNAALKAVSLSVGATGLLVKIVKYGLYLNSMYDGDFGENFGSDVATSIIKFRKFMKYPNEDSGVADYTVIKGLVTSNGDTGRDSIALDTATQLTATDVQHFRDYGFSIVGRYLTGTVGADFKPKNLTSTEVKTILDGGLKFFPIYEDGGYVESYFTAAQGQKDGQTAISTALSLGLPADTVIYFAVDVDFQEGDIDGTVIPYINAVQNVLIGSIYKTGIYGTRNVCLHAEKAGISYSFVANMSYGWSGNLGFKMPDNWAFDQFVEYPIYGIDIDQDASSNRDMGVAKVNSPTKDRNTPFFDQLKSVEDYAFAYIQQTGVNTTPAELIAQFYRQFKYVGADWIPVAGGTNTGWLAKVNASLGVSGANQIEPLYDSATGIRIGTDHLMAALNSLLFWGEPQSASGIQDLGGWCGDLLTAINDAHRQIAKYNSFYDSLTDVVGKGQSFGPEDLIDDMDAINLYSSIRTENDLPDGATPSAIITEYYSEHGNEQRANSYLNNRFDGSLDRLSSDTNTLLTGGTGSWGQAYSVALAAFKKFKAPYDYSSSEAVDAAKVYKNVIDSHL
ncbi:glycoside hydrolase domain-containing protein [Lacticaseibacillus casei]|uniref:DUF1906 domain-containing protein n=1 Tax=Lacticaseibacillus casei TaxID=1582 RepID=A0ABZ0C098_LACCA|nr:glycoside hydrolase domain-containing protein [Lacticaseibacillus casei]KAB1970224.1 DUF1906 domain-containing protein [Lacticaseibacillus casei]WNX26236.1 DUF1906 domain-containing protein [Lacticaseibacillus casei]WNX29011.1 DUF1906 domain-containing protein [Lacticaseibacillus casei]